MKKFLTLIVSFTALLGVVSVQAAFVQFTQTPITNAISLNHSVANGGVPTSPDNHNVSLTLAFDDVNKVLRATLTHTGDGTGANFDGTITDFGLSLNSGITASNFNLNLALSDCDDMGVACSYSDPGMTNDLANGFLEGGTMVIEVRAGPGTTPQGVQGGETAVFEWDLAGVSGFDKDDLGSIFDPEPLKSGNFNSGQAFWVARVQELTATGPDSSGSDKIGGGITTTTVTNPEPATGALLGMGLLGALVARRRRALPKSTKI